jgi:hypothetical protein|tara:strand:- start:747 stop:1160 length:414 start_codon:yes stop_codon:yes gene_type:complete
MRLTLPKKLTTRQQAIKAGYRSGLEHKTAEMLKKKKVKYTYEETKIKWEDYRIRKYTPDFILHNGIVIETKGRFTREDRRKHLAIKRQYGKEYDIRFVFSNSRSKLDKGAKSTYGEWCTKNGFLYADKEIPQEWIDE